MTQSHHSPKLLIYALLLSAFCLPGCNKEVNPPQNISSSYRGNVLVAFFNEAELQIETKEQHRELSRALQDMLTLPPDALRKQRYANYQMEQNKWTLNEILSRYYYARPPIEFNELLYRDVATSEARDKIKQALKKVNDRNPVNSF